MSSSNSSDDSAQREPSEEKSSEKNARALVCGGAPALQVVTLKQSTVQDTCRLQDCERACKVVCLECAQHARTCSLDIVVQVSWLVSWLLVRGRHGVSHVFAAST